jgi:hypothetical protein
MSEIRGVGERTVSLDHEVTVRKPATAHGEDRRAEQEVIGPGVDPRESTADRRV